jgi:hypothetical protein
MNDHTKKELLLNEISQLGNALQYVNTFYNNIVNLLHEDDIDLDNDTDEDEDDTLTDEELIEAYQNNEISGFIGSASYLNRMINRRDDNKKK